MAGEQRAPESLNLFRRTDQPDFCCAVPERLPVPAFIRSPRWEFAGTLGTPSPAPLGRRTCSPARSGFLSLRPHPLTLMLHARVGVERLRTPT